MNTMLYIPDFSYDDHLVYEIKKEDTLQSVAQKLQIEADELRGYHNKFCPIKDLIERDFNSDLKFLILESQEAKEEKEEHREHVYFKNNDLKLSFSPSGLNTHYLAMYVIENGDTKHTVKEEMSVKWLRTDSNGFLLLEIDRVSRVYVNDEESTTMADQLAEKTAGVFYPLQVISNEDGEFVDIYNFEAIRKRWQKIKKVVRKEFRGDAVEKALRNFEKKLENDTVIYDALFQDLFLKVFFNNLHITYTKALTTKMDFEFAVTQKNGLVRFIADCSILPKVDAYNLINVTQKGVLSDSRSKTDFENDLLFPEDDSEEVTEKPEGSYEAYYFLDPVTKALESVFLECELQLENLQKTTIIISNMTEKAKLNLSSVSLIVEEKKEEKNNVFRNFWEVITGR